MVEYGKYVDLLGVAEPAPRDVSGERQAAGEPLPESTEAGQEGDGGAAPLQH